MGAIRRVFLNVSMSNRIEGLGKIAKDSGIETTKLSHDSYLVFVNAQRDKIAMLVGPHIADKPAVMARFRQIN